LIEPKHWPEPQRTRLHGELLKLGIQISQATVARYILRAPHSPSATWRSFLRSHALGIAAIDMFIVRRRPSGCWS